MLANSNIFTGPLFSSVISHLDALSKCYQQKCEDHGAAIKQLIVKQIRYYIANHPNNDKVAGEVKWFRIF
jgi:hypothetical protein